MKKRLFTTFLALALTFNFATAISAPISAEDTTTETVDTTAETETVDTTAETETVDTTAETETVDTTAETETVDTTEIIETTLLIEGKEVKGYVNEDGRFNITDPDFVFPNIENEKYVYSRSLVAEGWSEELGGILWEDMKMEDYYKTCEFWVSPVIEIRLPGDTTLAEDMDFSALAGYVKSRTLSYNESTGSRITLVVFEDVFAAAAAVDYVRSCFDNPIYTWLAIPHTSNIEDENVFYGDLYDDDFIGLNDIILFGKYLGNRAELTERQKFLADVYNDDKLDTSDLTLLIKSSFGEYDGYLPYTPSLNTGGYGVRQIFTNAQAIITELDD